MMEERIVIWVNKEVKKKWEVLKKIWDFDNEEMLEFLLKIAEDRISEATDEELERIIKIAEKLR